jgi:hypothetical protein
MYNIIIPIHFPFSTWRTRYMNHWWAKNNCYTFQKRIAILFYNWSFSRGSNYKYVIIFYYVRLKYKNNTSHISFEMHWKAEKIAQAAVNKTYWNEYILRCFFSIVNVKFKNVSYSLSFHKYIDSTERLCVGLMVGVFEIWFNARVPCMPKYVAFSWTLECIFSSFIEWWRYM